MDRLSVDIMGISEIRWPESGGCTIINHHICYSGNTNGELVHGVGVIQNITNFIPISERILVMQLNSILTKTDIIQAYAPTADESIETNQ